MSIPKLAIGDGAMGFWAALEEVYPQTRQQRCWMHKTINVLNCLPKSAQPKAALHSIWQAQTKPKAETAFDLFITTPVSWHDANRQLISDELPVAA